MKNTYHHKDLRKALLEAALDILKEKSFAQMSMRELAIKTRVSHGAPYRHFKDKEALLAALSIIGYEKIKTVCNNAYSNYQHYPEKALEEAGTGYLLFVYDNPEIAKLMFTGIFPLENWPPELHIAVSEAIESLQKIVKLGKSKKVFAAFNAEDLSLVSLSMIHGMSMFMVTGLLSNKVTDRQSLKKLAKRSAKIMFNGLTMRD